MASCGVSEAALSDKITIVSFIEAVVAQEVKSRVDLILSRCNMLNGPLLKVQKVPLIIQMEKA